MKRVALVALVSVAAWAVSWGTARALGLVPGWPVLLAGIAVLIETAALARWSGRAWRDVSIGAASAAITAALCVWFVAAVLGSAYGGVQSFLATGALVPLVVFVFGLVAIGDLTRPGATAPSARD